jgi:uncharacterized DUF497 family protein
VVHTIRIFTHGGFEWAFLGPVVEWEDQRRDYGERRFVAVGEAGGQVVTVVCTRRGNRYRIISARSASGEEKAAYRQVRPA